ncbi:MAG: hypothetical protein ACLUHE_11230 [Christensenellales bacterium]
MLDRDLPGRAGRGLLLQQRHRRRLHPEGVHRADRRRYPRGGQERPAGRLRGCGLQCVTLYDGSYHDVDSSEVAFKIAGSMAFKDGYGQGRSGAA